MNTIKSSMIMAAFIMLMISCNKTETKVQPALVSLSSATKAALQSPTLVSLKQSYKMLSDDEKQVLWDIKWSTILQNDRALLTPDQKRIILSIKQFVDHKTIAALMKDPSDGEKFIRDNLPEFSKHFSKPELYMIIECPYFCEGYSLFKSMDYLSGIDKKISILTGKVIDGEPDCECYYSISCWFSKTTSVQSSCVDGKCVKNANCGLTGTSNCTGMCS